MQFINFISDANNIIGKSYCPEQCEFKSRNNIPIVGIPEPQKQKRLLGVIISRDPTTDFIDPYFEARQKTPEGWHNQLMTAKAPPQWIIVQIARFNKKHLNEQYTTEIEHLKEIIENNVYWTHYHKCCTDKSSEKAPRFKKKNARLCANQWLRDELSEVIDQGVKFIICVGKDAKAWVSEWEKDAGIKDI